MLHDAKKTIQLIDETMMTPPPSAEGWKVDRPDQPRFGWDERYQKQFKQDFSPWFFIKNCSAVLGYVNMHGPNDLSKQMAEHLASVAEKHIEKTGTYRYVRNDFNFGILWHNMLPPFYGSFMNNVTAAGYLFLYEATAETKYLSTAQLLMQTSIDPDAPIPLSGVYDGEFWLNEYIFHSDIENAAWAQFARNSEWHGARIYNGHMHALLPLMRFREMTGRSDWDDAIQNAINTMSKQLPLQPFENKYFSYGIDARIYPDYNQKRAAHLAEGLAALTQDPAITKAAADFKILFEKLGPTKSRFTPMACWKPSAFIGPSKTAPQASKPFAGGARGPHHTLPG